MNAGAVEWMSLANSDSGLKPAAVKEHIPS